MTAMSTIDLRTFVDRNAARFAALRDRPESGFVRNAVDPRLWRARAAADPDRPRGRHRSWPVPARRSGPGQWGPGRAHHLRHRARLRHR
jgi:hypothetical protein